METERIEGQALAFASQIPDYMSLVLRQGEPHETDDEFDPVYTLSKEKRAADATLFPLDYNAIFDTSCIRLQKLHFICRVAILPFYKSKYSFAG